MPTLQVKVVPGSTRNRIVGRYGEGLKVQVSAPPERGKANEAVIELLAEAFGVKAGCIELVSGASGPRKVFAIHGVHEAELRAKLQELQ